MTPLIENDAVVLGLLLVTLAAIFKAEQSEHPLLKRFFRIVPALLLCYFIPSLMSSIGLISGEKSQLYFVASRYLLPTCLVFLTLSIDLPSVLRLGPKAIVLFLTGTLGIVIGGPIAVLVTAAYDPSIIGGEGPEAVWRGMTTVAGSWIGGGANQTAMKEVFEVGDKIFSAMIAVDVLCANAWMAVLLYLAPKAKLIDEKMGADTTAIDALRERVEEEQKRLSKVPTTTDLFMLLAVGFGVTALAHLWADALSPWILENYAYLKKFSLTSKFFWLIVIATTFGVGLSFTSARKLEGVGASRIGSVFLYILVATIGMKMDLHALADAPALFVVGGIWLGIHAVLMVVVARLMKAPLFFLAVGSQANVGGAASAPVVASAFHPALAPVGVLLAVLGYALGTYAAFICGQLLRMAAP
ncbi:MAG: DUF819 family protein [Deltaproteobacteria bacterium]|nr:DUF819 family protein [Deltaproteobacteria bacterium]